MVGELYNVYMDGTHHGGIVSFRETFDLLYVFNLQGPYLSQKPERADHCT